MRKLSALIISATIGCSAQSPPATHREAGEPPHSHERDKMKLADLGKEHHAGLTAHLSSKTGNELDIFIEAADEAHTPTPLAVMKLVARSIAADGTAHDLVFEPSEPEERKDDPPGKCSHFVAKVPWMKPGDTLTVTANIAIDGQTHTVEWKEFNPKRFAHFEE